MKNRYKQTTKLILTSMILVGLLMTNAFALDLSSWTTKANMVEATYAFGSTCLNDKIYVFGGLSSSKKASNTLQVYDSATNTWDKKTSMPAAGYNMSVAEVNGKIYTIGGGLSDWTLTNVNKVYNPATDTWETKTSMPDSLSACATATFGNKIYLFGGEKNNTVEKIVYVYDTVTDTWTTKSSMQTARSHCAAVVANNLIYVIGGRNGETTYNTVEAYDPLTDKWTTVGSTAEDKIAAKALNINGDIYLFGGLINNAVSASNKIEKYNYESNSWSVVGTLPENRGELGAALINNSVYLVGGRDTSSTVYNTAIVSALPVAEGNALLRITMITGESKEYDMTTDKVDAFVTWYNGEPDGSSYLIDTTYNLGSLKSRKNYIAYNKIAFFEVMAYDDAASSTSSTTKTYTSLLKVTMATGDEMEYEMTADELSAFTTWYNGKATSSPAYSINKDYNKGPFTSRVDYIAYTKIANFEVMEY